MVKLIFILDALRADSFPIFQENIKKINFKRILPPFSFEPDAAFLTGRIPEETDSGTHYWLEPQASLFNKVNYLCKVLPESPPYLRKAGKKILIKALELKGFNVDKIKSNLGSIPFRYLEYFSPSKSINLFDKNTKFKYETIFNKLKNTGIRYGYYGVPFNNGSLNNIKSDLKISELLDQEIIFFYISDLDAIGHKYGGNSREYDEKLVEIIDFINSIKKYLSKNNISSDLITFGDHGMVNIKRTINVNQLLQKIPYKVEKDYLYFLDSTLARFWFKNKSVRDYIIKALPNNEYGSWITDEEKENYNINYSHSKFGEAIWWAAEGTLILPNFWQGRNKVKGMHGYRDIAEENHTMIIGGFNYDNKSKYIAMTEVFKILLNFLELN